MNHSQAWLKKITPDIFDFLSLSDKGTPPPFPLKKFGESLKESLHQKDFSITIQKMDFIEEGAFFSGLGKKTLSTPLALSPLNGIFHLVMGINDIKTLISCMEEKDDSSILSLENDSIIKGIYTYFVVEAIDSISKLGIYKDLSLKITDGEVSELLAFAIDFTLLIKGNHLMGRILIPKAFYKAFQAHYAFIPPTLENLEEIPDINIPMSIHTGSISLSQKELKELEEGDFLLLHNTFYFPSKEKGSFQMKVGNRSLFQVKKQKDGIKILDYLYFYNEENMDEEEDFGIDEEFLDDESDLDGEIDEEIDEDLEEDLEEDTDTSLESDALLEEDTTFKGPEKTNLSDIPLTISMEIARFSLSLGELKKMGPGFKLPININPSKVNLMIAGKCIGTGEIIEIGDVIGVKITSLSK